MPTHHLFVLTGASRGLGLAMAQQLLQADHTLVCLSRQINSHLQEQATATGSTLLQWSQDLIDAQAASERLGQWLQTHGPKTFASATLINNAGAIPPLAPLSASATSDLAQALRLGLEAPMLLCASFLQATQAWTGPRKILNISSGLGRRAMASQSAYCAAKAGMDHFTRCMALDEALTPNGARVCSLAPGVIDTDMQVQLRSAPAAGFPDQDRFIDMHRSGQLTSPVQAARAVLGVLMRADFGTQPVDDVRG